MRETLKLEQFLLDLAFYVNRPTSTALIQNATPNQSLVDDLEFDSVAMLELQLGCEERYDIGLNCEEVGACQTVSEVFELVKRKMASG